MELERKIQKARNIIASFKGEERARLRDIGLEIQNAQDALNKVADDFFRDCQERCHGICCRNIGINDVVTLLDLIFILVLQEDIGNRMQNCAQAETLFTADCLFLQNKIGPCIFAANVKPERCIITFCKDTAPIKRQIRTVRSRFTKLFRYTLIRRPFLWIGIR